MILWVLVLLEGGLRFMASQRQIPNRVPADIFAAHPIGWHLEPDLEAGIASANGVVEIHTNHAGFRDENYDLERSPDKKRILILGDSFTLALETPQKQVFHVQLENRMQAEMISLGVSGYELLQHYLVYQHIGATYHADEVVLMLFPSNDLRGNLSWEHLPHYTLENGALTLHGFPYEGEFDLPLVTTQRSTALMRHSMLAFVIGSVTRPQPTTKSEEENYGYCTYWGSVNYPEPDEADWALSTALLSALRDLVEANGSRFRVVIIPGEYQIEADDRAEFLRQCPAYANHPTIQEALIPLLDANQIEYLDLLPPLTTARSSNNERFYIAGDDIHWTPAGHTAVAQALEDFLTRP